MARIHPTALIDPNAQISETAEIGPYCVIGPDVKIGERVKLISNVYVTGKTTIGDDCQCFPNVTLGTVGQILGAADVPNYLEIGARTILRENVMISGADPENEEPTRIGSDCFFMVNTHIGHDCQIGNKCVLAPGVMIGGKSIIHDQVWMGGAVAIHQNSWVGAHCMIGAGSMVTGDVVPYVITQGNHAGIAAINVVGLRRRGFNKSDLKNIRGMLHVLFQGEGSASERLQKAEAEYRGLEHCSLVLDFVTAKRSGRPLCQFRDD